MPFQGGVFHEPNNDDRRGWARETLLAFCKTICRGDEQDALADFLCDAMHLCERESARWGVFENALRRAVSNYEAEKQEEAEGVSDE